MVKQDSTQEIDLNSKYVDSYSNLHWQIFFFAWSLDYIVISLHETHVSFPFPLKPYCGILAYNVWAEYLPEWLQAEHRGWTRTVLPFERGDFFDRECASKTRTRSAHSWTGSKE